MTTALRSRLLACLLATLAAPGTAQTGNPVQPAQDQILGSRARIEPDSPGHRWLERGAEIRESPDWRAPVIAIVDIRVQVPIAENDGDWLLVRYAGWKGWIHATGERESSEEPATESPPEPYTTAPDKAIIDAAIAALDLNGRDGAKLGSFDLLTDVEDEKTLAFLDRIARQLPAAYEKRYGLDTGTETLESVVLFADDADYRAFTRSTTETPGLSSGHATRGLAVVAIGRRPLSEVTAVLVHELTHLLNRRVFGPIVVPWLDEGMGNDLAYCKIRKRTGEIEIGSLGGRSVVVDHPVYLAGGESRVDREVRLEGPKASLSLLRDSESRLPIEVLTRLEQPEFMDPLDLRTRYDQSTFFVRFLLDSGDTSRASSFLDYLERLAAVGQDAMTGASGTVPAPSFTSPSLTDIDGEFEAWLARRR